VVSGGFSHQAGVQVWQSMKDGNGWRIAATNSDTAARSLNVTATCIFNSNGTVNIASQEQPAKPNNFTQITAECPSGSIVTGGGWDVDNNTFINVYQSFKSDNGWQVNFNNPNNSASKVTAYAICLTGVPGSTSQKEKTENIIPPNSTANAQMNCPFGSFATGGGFSIDRDLILYHSAKEINGWANYVSNPTGEEKRLDTFVVCYQP